MNDLGAEIQALMEPVPGLEVRGEWPNFSPVHRCVLRNAGPDLVRRIIESLNRAVIQNKDFWGRTPLHMLAEKGSKADLAVARELVRFFPASEQDGAGRNVFHYISWNNCDVAFFDMLVKHLADHLVALQQKCDDGMTPFMMGLKHSETDSLPLLMRFIRAGVPLTEAELGFAAAHGNLEVTKTLRHLRVITMLCHERRKWWSNRKPCITVLPLELLWCVKMMLY